MNHPLHIYLLLGYFCLFTPTAKADQKEQAKGFYSNGSLQNAENIGLEAPGLLKLFQPRNRGFATTDLVWVIKQAAASLLANYPNQRDRMQVGDLSDHNGGRIGGHTSHQNGLDADIAYIRLNQTEQDPQVTSGFVESFVLGNWVTSNFDSERNYFLAKSFIKTGKVQRIFVNPVVRKELCDYSIRSGQFFSDKDIIKRIREYPGHDEHMHIRLTCPIGSTKCKGQEEVPEAVEC